MSDDRPSIDAAMRRSLITRAVGLLPTVLASGSLIGISYAAGFSSPVFLVAAPIGAILGAVIGLITSPISVSSMMFKRLDHAWLVIYPISLLTAALGGFVDFVTGKGNDGPGLGLLVTVCMFVVACVLSARALPRRWRPLPAGACPSCGYDLRNLTSAICPECGSPASAPQEPQKT